MAARKLRTGFKAQAQVTPYQLVIGTFSFSLVLVFCASYIIYVFVLHTPNSMTKEEYCKQIQYVPVTTIIKAVIREEFIVMLYVSSELKP